MYLYVDAQYFRKVFQDKLLPYLGVEVGIDWLGLRLLTNAQRVFIYDSVDDVQRDGESKIQHEKRVEAHRLELDTISSLDGYFLRLGSVRGNVRKRRQKEVDVLLAVDMLTHSHRKITTHTMLLSGDMDFKPLLEAVVAEGTHVTVLLDPEHASRDLEKVADRKRRLSLRFLWECSTGPRDPSFSRIFPHSYGDSYTGLWNQVAVGEQTGRKIFIREQDGQILADLTHGDFQVKEELWVNNDIVKMKLFLEDEFGRISWS